MNRHRVPAWQASSSTPFTSAPYPYNSCTFPLPSAQVYSENIVGYNTVVPDGPYSMVGISFAECAGGSLMLEKLTGTFSSGDEIQIPYTTENGFDFVSYQYLTMDNDGMDNGWYDLGWDYVGDTVQLPQGSAVWYYSASGSGNVSVSGEVSKLPFSQTFSDPYTMVASGFPVAFNPNDAQFSWSMSSGDEIQVPYTTENGFDFVSYQYLTMDNDGMDDGWYDLGWGLLEGNIVSVGQGFWVYSQNGGSVTEVSPIAE